MNALTPHSASRMHARGWSGVIGIVEAAWILLIANRNIPGGEDIETGWS